MNKTILMIIPLLFFISSRIFSQDSGKITDSDSLEYVMSLFLWRDTFSIPNKWVLEEKDIDEVYKTNPDWIKRYCPEILDIRDLPFYVRANLSCYLYLEGEKDYLFQITTDTLNDRQKQILYQYLNNFDIVPDDKNE
jgi:hypothetical protein